MCIKNNTSSTQPSPETSLKVLSALVHPSSNGLGPSSALLARRSVKETTVTRSTRHTRFPVESQRSMAAGERNAICIAEQLFNKGQSSLPVDTETLSIWTLWIEVFRGLLWQKGNFLWVKWDIRPKISSLPLKNRPSLKREGSSSSHFFLIGAVLNKL